MLRLKLRNDSITFGQRSNSMAATSKYMVSHCLKLTVSFHWDTSRHTQLIYPGFPMSVRKSTIWERHNGQFSYFQSTFILPMQLSLTLAKNNWAASSDTYATCPPDVKHSNACVCKLSGLAPSLYTQALFVDPHNSHNCGYCASAKMELAFHIHLFAAITTDYADFTYSISHLRSHYWTIGRVCKLSGNILQMRPFRFRLVRCHLCSRQ